MSLRTLVRQLARTFDARRARTAEADADHGQALAALLESESTARALLNVPTYAAVLVDREGLIVALNGTAISRLNAHAEALGRQQGESVVGACVFDWFPPDLREARRARNDLVFETGAQGRYEDERHGEWTEYSIDPVFDKNGDVARIAIFSRDITDRKLDEQRLLQHAGELEQITFHLSSAMAELARSQDALNEKSMQLEQLLEAAREHARRDALTGALNHGAISEIVRDLIEAETPCAVAMVDVDGMKAANDTYGHQLGDAVLRAVVAAITREKAVVGRYGGDEFLVALPQATRAEAQAYADSVRAALCDARVFDDASLASMPVLASVGLALYPDDASSAVEVIERADEAMYLEKKARREESGPGLPTARSAADERAAKTVGELVPLFTAPGSLDEKLRLVSERLSAVCGYAGVSFQVLDGQSKTLAHHNAALEAPDDVIADAWRAEQGRDIERPMLALLARTRVPLIMDDVASETRFAGNVREILVAAGIRSAISVPLLIDDTLIGTMGAGSHELAAFSARDAHFLMAIGAQVTAIIRMTRLTEKLERATLRLGASRDETVMMLAAAAEAHSQSTPEHPARVRALSEVLALELGYGPEESHEIGLAAALHDIGGLEVPDALLSSPVRLDAADPAMARDWERMKRHCLQGEQFLGRAPGFDLAALVARNHHERWDGNGYPDGRRGEEIPAAAAIVAVADALEAIVSERRYRSSRPLAGAMTEMVARSGTQFSPAVVDALVRLDARDAIPLEACEHEQFDQVA